MNGTNLIFTLVAASTPVLAALIVWFIFRPIVLWMTHGVVEWADTRWQGRDDRPQPGRHRKTSTEGIAWA